VLAVTDGRLYSELRDAIDSGDLPVSTLKLNRIKPLELPDSIMKYGRIVFFEEGIKTGGVAEQTLAKLSAAGWNGEFVIRAVDDTFVPHSTVKEALAALGLDRAGMAASLKEIISG
jgi:1-deoxy-D-xylulose-5-phosphate synthase